MSFIIKELTEFKHFREFIKIQEKIFKLKDIDKISPALLNMFARRNPPIGIVLGAFEKNENKESLIGFLLSTASMKNDSIYNILMGVLPEFQAKNLGIKLILSLRNLAIDRGIKYFYFLYEPLDGNLAYLYISKIGCYGINYEKSAFELFENNISEKDIPIDKILTRWDIQSFRVEKRLSKKHKKQSFKKILKKYPLVTEDNLIYRGKILIEIPGYFLKLKNENPEKALNWRIKTRRILGEYINNRGFYITDFYSIRESKGRKNYYLLEKIKNMKNDCGNLNKEKKKDK